VNKQKLNSYLLTLKSPAFLIGVTVVMGLFLNLYILSLFVFPVFTQHAAADTRVQSLISQKETVGRNPTPMKATDEDIELQLRQVPLKDEMPLFFLNLKEFEKQSGAILNNFQYGDGSQDPNGMAALMGSVGAPNTAAANQAPKANTAPNAANPIQTPNSGKNIEEINMTMVISGTFTQVTTFIRLLDQAERLISIREWSLQAGGGSGDKAKTAGGGQSQPMPVAALPNEADSVIIDKVTVTLKLSLYTAKGYIGKFKEQPLLPLKEVDRRVDPTWSEQQFLRLLETQN
jgi:hypothetical protein